MANAALSPIGSSSGLLSTLEARPQPAHGHSPKAAGWAGLAASVSLHASILVLGALLIQKLPVMAPSQTAQNQTFQPDTIFDDKQVTKPGIKDNSLTTSQLRPTFGTETGEESLKARGDALNSVLNSDAPTNLNPNIALGAHPSSLPKTSIGTGDTGIMGNQKGIRSGEVIPFLRTGTGDGAGYQSPVAERVVFLCDATGTMTGLKFDLLKRELNSTVGKLKPTTSFNVVLFADEKAEAFDKALQPATPQNKKKMADFLAKTGARGATNPLPGLKQAFGMKPQVIFFLSDGAFDNLVSYGEVLKTVETLNKDKKVRVYTILFGDRDAQAEETLKKMAADNGGSFSLVDPDQLLK